MNLSQIQTACATAVEKKLGIVITTALQKIEINPGFIVDDSESQQIIGTRPVSEETDMISFAEILEISASEQPDSPW
jgi:hypothetical protein